MEGKLILLKLWLFLQGYLLIRINGQYVERLLNFAITRGIKLWDVTFLNKDTLFFKIGINGFKKIRSLVRQAKCRASIIKKTGMPFYIKKIWQRKGFLAGFCFFIMTLYTLSLFIWVVDIKGLKKTPADKFNQSLRELNLARGAYKSQLSIDYKRRKLLQQFDGISWLGMEVKGSVLQIRVIEKVLPVKPKQKEVIYAARDGLVTKVVVISGRAMVSEGDTVRKGDPLIIGGPLQIMTEGEKGPELRDIPDSWQAARGYVEALVWYQTSVKVPMVFQKSKPTGRKEQSFRLKIGGLEFTLGRRKPSFMSYRVKRKTLPLLYGRNQESIVEIKHEQFLEISYKKVKLTENQAIHKGAVLAGRHLDRILRKKTVKGKERLSTKREGNLLIVTLSREIQEEIGRAW